MSDFQKFLDEALKNIDINPTDYEEVLEEYDVFEEIRTQIIKARNDLDTPVNLPIMQQRCQTSWHLHIISTPSCTLYFASEETVQKKSQNSLSFILFFARHVLTLQTKSKKTKNDVRN